MFGFTKTTFIEATGFIGLSRVNPLKCISISRQECKSRPVIMNINSNERSFYPYSILVNKCIGSWNDINDLYAKLRVLDVIKDMNIKVFDLMSRTNETRQVSWH